MVLNRIYICLRNNGDEMSVMILNEPTIQQQPNNFWSKSLNQNDCCVFKDCCKAYKKKGKYCKKCPKK
jgi:ferric iron reductase protein FhuF